MTQLFFATRSNWLAVVITIAAGALVTVAYANLVDLDWPRRIAICDGGLVVDQWDGGIRPVPWADIISAGQVARPGPSVVFELVVKLADRVETMELGSYTARSALTRSILARHPVPISQWPRAVVSAVLAAGRKRSLCERAGTPSPCTSCARAARSARPACSVRTAPAPGRKLGDAEVFTTPNDAQLHQAVDAYIARPG